MGNKKINNYCKNSVKVGFFLAVRQLKRTSKWTTFFIILIMFFTFLSLTAVSGILSGLVEGSSKAYREGYSGDLILSNYESKQYITNSSDIINTLESFSEVEVVSPRLIVGGIGEVNYKVRNNFFDKTEQIPVQIAGIDPQLEDKATHLSQYVINGQYLSEDDHDQVLVGSNLLEVYSRGIPGNETLSKADVGSKIKLRINGSIQEFTIKGVIKNKSANVSQRIYLPISHLRKILKQINLDVNEVAVFLKEGSDPYKVKEALKLTNVCDCALVETWQESQGQFFKDISNTFNVLGILIGSVSLIVSSITIFIVIFINALNRKRFIGILKSIGICSLTIKISYTFQAFFYAVIGSGFGLVVLYGVLKPYIDKNPIDFPFSDGILTVPLELTIIRIAVILIVSLLAGYLPARIIVRKNTLNSILGR